MRILYKGIIMDIFFVGSNVARLIDGVKLTLYISLISIGFSLLGGTLLGIAMNVRFWLIRALSRFYLESIRIIPILAWLFIVFFGFSQYANINLTATQSAIIVFSLWGIAEMGDLVRSSITSLPKHQIESARALALSEWQMQIFIIFPQVLRRLSPSLVSLFTRMIKTTSLVALIGAVDLLKVGQQIIELNKSYANASFWVYGGIFLTYFVLCYPLSLFAQYLERKYL